MMQRIPYLAIIIALSLTVAAVAQSNIDPNHKSAWGENIGWQDWRDANGSIDGVRVHATFLSGYMWAENVGWISVGDGSPAGGTHYANTDGSDFGVNIDSNGDLFGLAWGENIGWVNFDTRDKGSQRARMTSIDCGRFRGYVWGENVGWINLDDGTAYVARDSFITGDFVCDGDVDLSDFGHFSACFNGPNRPAAWTGCDDADFDADNDVDLTDFSVFAACFNGPNRPPACP